jgi:hypothetical protein
MKRFLSRVVVALTFAAVAMGAPVLAQQSLEPLTNASVIKLVRAGFKEKTVIAIIQSRPNKFDLNAERLIDLKHNGVTENVILAMISQGEMQFGTDDWGDDSFFKKGSGAMRGAGGDPAKQGGVDIFGSGGSSSNRPSAASVGTHLNTRGSSKSVSR